MPAHSPCPMLTIECQRCGATIRKRSARYCEFCGTEVVRGDVASKLTRDERRAMRFEMLHAAPELRRSLVHPPELENPPLHTLGTIVLSLGAIGVLVVFMRMVGDQLSVALSVWLPVLMMIVFARILIGMALHVIRYRTAEFLARPAIVVEEATAASRGARKSGTLAQHYLTLEFANGERGEFGLAPALAGQVEQGDAGVAFLKFNYCVAFERVEA